MKPRRLLSILLAAVMLLSIVPLTPVVATAETPTTVAKDITLGYFALHDADTENAKWDYVYFGTYNNEAIKWRVLSTNGNTTIATNAEDGPVTNTATYKTAGDAEYTGKALFMLSENTLFNTLFYGTTSDNVWLTSNLRSQMQDNIFGSTSNELKYVLKTTKEDTPETIDYIDSYNKPYSRKWAKSTLSDDTLFALSAREAEQYLGSGDKYANRISGNAAWWWLRSPCASDTDRAGVVNDDGVVNYGPVDFNDGARPALNLNLSSVLFTSAAFGGKSSTAAEGGVTENKNYGNITDNDGYKLTLLDESRSGFSAYLKSLSGNTATVSYSGATTGENEWISVIVKNGTDVKYYGRVADVTDASDASGTVEITLPGDYDPASGDVLCVFNEQCNGNYKTDYASDLVVLPDYRWYTNDTTKSVFTISTVSEMVGFANLVNGTNLPDGVSGPVTFESKTVKLADDIDLKSIANWTPIGKYGSDFEGTFDGNDKTVSNLKVNSGKDDSDVEYVGLFGGGIDATVKDLAVSGNVTGTGSSSSVGGIVGWLNGGSITNCSFSGNVTGNGVDVGGIVGWSRGTISECRNYATVSGSAIKLGGIVGLTYKDVQYCYNQGSVITSEGDYNSYLGGIVGDVDEFFGDVAVTSCYNTGSISATRTNATIGGTIGRLYSFGSTNTITIDGCYFLDSAAKKGIGLTEARDGATITGEAEGKSSTAFASGEVAWLLQNAADDADGQVWGQTLTGSNKDACPVFANENGSNKVYKVTLVIDENTTDVNVNGGAISVPDPFKEGYSFDGWYTSQTGDTEVTSITADTTLYARFTPNTYTVTYNAGANGTGTVAAGSKTHGVNFTLSSNTFTRTGYTQTGWATSDGGDKVYDLGGSYTVDTAVTLYPVWTINQYTITVKPENGNINIPIKQDYGTPVTAPTLTRDGYEFDGWDKTFPTTMPAEDMTITAKWKDVTAPTGEIKLGNNGWKTFLNNITFGLFFKDTEEVTITATDNGGETVKIEYLLSDKELTAEELATATFTAYSDKFTVEPNNKYVIYAKLSDKTDNVAYINSNGIVLDNVAPVISGITNGETYCAAQTVTVSDKYDVTVTVNGTPVTLDTNGQFTLSPASGTQTVVAKDQAGNVSAEMIVTINDGHEGGTATCTKKAECKHCGLEYGEVDGNNHSNLNREPEKAATANALGNIEHWHCSGCNKYFSDSACKNELGSVEDTYLYAVIFNTDGGNAVDSKTAVKWEDTVLDGITDPIKSGYEFKGWKCGTASATDSTKYSALAANKTTASVELTAQWKDVTAPTGEITLGKNSWKNFLNNITFGLFFKDTQEITITATDNGGEAVKIEYLLSDKELTAEELATATFTAYSDKFTVEPNNEYVIYAKLTDKSDNVAYINSNGIVLDNVAPVISGIANGKTYCAAQTVTVSDKYEVTVTVNGTPVTLDANGQFTLSPASGTQTVVAKDQAGNVSAEMIVTVNDGHTYEWQSENGQYWQKCKFCGNETAKKDIPEITVNGADKVCVTQGYKFSFTLPEGSTDVTYGYEFENMADGGLEPKFENGIYSDTIPSNVLKDGTSFTLVVESTTADGYLISTRKDVQILQEHTGGTATCKDKAKCEVCGDEYGEVDRTNHTTLKHIEAKAATTEAEGNIEYWHCEDCNKYFSDKDGKNEITLADTVIAKLTKTESPKTGDNSRMALWFALLFVSGGALIGTVAYSKKKKYSAK